MNLRRCRAVIAQYYEPIKRYCHARLVTDFHGAEDCTQEVFRILLEKYQVLQEDEGIRVWLYHTADKVIANYLRKEQHHAHVGLDTVSGATDGGLAQITEESPLDVLSEKERELITAYYTEPLPKKEIAKRFGLTLAALYAAIYRIKKKLGQALETKQDDD